MRQRRRLGRFGLGLSTAILGLFLATAPTLACGGLIGPNGAGNLLRTTTLAGYHDGVEHYVTAFQFAGGGGAVGAITPPPGIPPSGVKGGDRAPPPPIPGTGPPSHTAPPAGPA